MRERVVITGAGAICAAGKDPVAIWEEVRSGRSHIGPIRQWDASRSPRNLAGEVADADPRMLVRDRKVHKLIRRTDMFGLHAATQAIESADLPRWRHRLDSVEAGAFNDRTGTYVGSGGSSYQDQYDFLPLLTRSEADLRRFGSELTQTVSPMWLLRTLPNNVLCHIGITYGFKGANACITNHSVSGALAVAEATEALRCGEVDRAVVVGHESPIEPQRIQYFDSLGLLTADAVRPFDLGRSGCVLGEGAGSFVLETQPAATSRGARVLGEVLGGACTSEASGLLPLNRKGEGLSRAIALALDDAGLRPADVGMLVAHGNGTEQSDASEAAAIETVFGQDPPPVTAFKWAFGHLLAASGIVDSVLSLLALQRREVPAIPTLREVASDCIGLPVSSLPQTCRSDIALVLSRGFGGMNVALLVRAPGDDELTESRTIW